MSQLVNNGLLNNKYSSESISPPLGAHQISNNNSTTSGAVVALASPSSYSSSSSISSSNELVRVRSTTKTSHHGSSSLIVTTEASGPKVNSSHQSFMAELLDIHKAFKSPQSLLPRTRLSTGSFDSASSSSSLSRIETVGDSMQIIMSLLIDRVYQVRLLLAVFLKIDNYIFV